MDLKAHTEYKQSYQYVFTRKYSDSFSIYTSYNHNALALKGILEIHY